MLRDILSLAVVTHSVEYAVHSLISLLAKLKISTHHGAKASNTAPEIFFCSRSDLALPERALRRSILQLRTPVRACRLSLAKHARLCDIVPDLPRLAVAPGVALNAQQASGSRCRGGMFRLTADFLFVAELSSRTVCGGVLRAISCQIGGLPLSRVQSYTPSVSPRFDGDLAARYSRRYETAQFVNQVDWSLRLSLR